MSSKESSMTVLVDRVNEEATECSKQTKEYRIILPRLPTGMLVTNSFFLHANMSGRPYKATDFKEVLFSIIDRKDLVALGPFQMSHVWMAVFANGAAKYKVKAQEELEIKKKKCLVIDPIKDEIKMKLLWLPPQLPDSEVKKVLEPFGTVKVITRERWRFSDLQETDTLTRFVTLVLKDHLSVDKVPHMLTIYGVNTLVVIPGRPPLCLRCKAVGHIRRQCSTPRCTQCWRYGHSTEECVVTYASKLQGNASPTADVSEHLMDVDEMFTKDLEPLDDSQESQKNLDNSCEVSSGQQEEAPKPCTIDALIQEPPDDPTSEAPLTKSKETRKLPTQITPPAATETEDERTCKKAKVDATNTTLAADPCCSKDVPLSMEDVHPQEQRGKAKFKERKKPNLPRSESNV
ncbi:unnamed protein product [Ixodes pacificus]